MKIKESNKLTPGDSFDWNTGNGKTVSVVVKEVYDHHVMCLMTEPPYLTKSIQNVDLFLQGIYKDSDVLRPIVTESARLKFMDKGV